MYVGCVNHKGMDCEQAYIAPKSWIIKWDENINHCTDKRTFIYSNKLKASKQGTDTRQSGHRGDGVFCRRGRGGGDSLYGVTHAQEYHNAFTLHHSCFENS